jgi:AraC family transcriptional regulator
MMVSKYTFGQFPARIIRTRRTGEFVCTETNYSAGRIISRHFHDHAGLVIVLDGGFTESFGRRELSCRSSNLLFRPSGEIHTDRFHRSGGRCLTIEIAPEWLKKASDHSIRLPETFLLGAYLPDAVVPRLYREFCGIDHLSSLAVEGLILETIVGFARTAESGPPRSGSIEQAREIIHERFAETVTIKEIAEAVGVHPVYLARAFRQQFGSTIGEYIRRLRIRKACFEILSSEKSLAQIASECGFFDQSHFSRTFKQMIGRTPDAYRKNLR